MRFVIQRVTQASVTVDSKTVGEINKGFLVLIGISQTVTLYADCKKGNRPSFINAGKPDMANELYEYIISECKKQFRTEKGVFGADMKVGLLNDGPFTILLDSDEICG